MVTGDHPITAKAIAKSVGIISEIILKLSLLVRHLNRNSSSSRVANDWEPLWPSLVTVSTIRPLWRKPISVRLCLSVCLTEMVNSTFVWLLFRCCHGYRRLWRLETGGWHDFVGRQLCVDRYRCRRRSSHLWQFEEIHRLHADFQNPRDFAIFALHLLWHSPAARNSHHLVYRFGYRHGKILESFLYDDVY